VSHPPPLFGREAERAALEQVVRHARRGGQIAVVEGEAGIGKTRLVQAALETAAEAGMTVLSARAEELEAHRPFAAIADLVGQERLEEHLGDWDLAPDVAGERQFRVAETVLELLDELCSGGPVVVAVEDLHWADPATIGVLARVAAGIERLPAALVVSARPQPRRRELERLLGLLAERAAVTVRLGPLGEAAIAELLEALLDARPGDRLARQVARAAGNPLFATELVGALVADGAITETDGEADLAKEDAAPSLPLTILHRLSFLPPDVLSVLGLASILGATFTASDLALLAGRPLSELVPVLTAAQRAGVLTERGDRLAFRHELVRDALYEDMPLSLRRGLHSQLAEALADAGEPIERAAEHVLRGAAPGDERAVESVVAAARDLVARSPGAAVDLYREAIELSGDPDAERARLLPELAEALVAAGLLDEGEQACREALARDLDAERASRLWLLLTTLLLRRGRTAEAVREGEAALAVPALGDAERMEVRALVAMARVFERQVEEAAEEARAVLDESSDDVARAIATNALAITADARGRFEEAAALLEPSVRWVDGAGSRAAANTRPHTIHGVMLARIDRLDEAEDTFERGRRHAEAFGMPEPLPMFHIQLALVHYLRGRLEDASAELASHAELAEQTRVGWRLPAESLRALIAIHRDEMLEAERHADAAEREAAAGGPPFGTDLMLVARAEVLEAAGRRPEALDRLAGAFEVLAAVSARTFIPVVAVALARLAAAEGKPERGAGVVEELEAIAGLNPSAPSLAAAPLQARGLLEGDADALRAAVDLLRGTGRVLETARAAEDAARVAGGGRELLEEARETYQASGAARDLARVDAALRALGARRGVSGPRRRRPATGWEALTDTELKVVRLVAERLTNPEIAERMFISRRTVQTHVSHALAKLGVSSRRELAAEAARRSGWRLRVDDEQEAEPAVEA
jgi:DNA-binding CsgD family transcriptional regulator/tetratricopeptide (TPR) repeat protein